MNRPLKIWKGTAIIIATSLFVCYLLNKDTSHSKTQTLLKNKDSTPKIHSPTAMSSNDIPDHISTTNTTISDHQASEALQSRNQLLATYPDLYYNPTNQSRTYLANLNRHYSIAPFVHSPLKDYESMQTLMHMLLENGYDVKDWGAAVNMLKLYHKSIDIRRSQLRDLGLPADDIQEQLDEFIETDRRLQSIKDGFTFTTGIRNKALLSDIFTLEFPAAGLEESLADPTLTILGDRLLTDSDWLTPEFQESQKKYSGLPKRPTQPGMQFLKPGSEKDTQRLLDHDAQ